MISLIESKLVTSNCFTSTKIYGTLNQAKWFSGFGLI